MLVKKITENIFLDIKGDVLSLISGEHVLISGFSDIGSVANGLIPVIYFNEKKFVYVDTETLDIFNIEEVNWISGMHFSGSSLNYLGANFRTDPLSSISAGGPPIKFNITEKVSKSLNQIEGILIEKKIGNIIQNRTHSATIDKAVAKEIFGKIKYIRIVGIGNLQKNLSMGSNPVKTDEGTYHPKQYFLSEKNSKYGVIDIKTNKIILSIEFENIEIFPNIIQYDNEQYLSY